MEIRVGKKYRLGRKIGSGSFGDMYVINVYYTSIYFYHFEYILILLVFLDIWEQIWQQEKKLQSN